MCSWMPGSYRMWVGSVCLGCVFGQVEGLRSYERLREAKWCWQMDRFGTASGLRKLVVKRRLDVR